MMIDKTQKIAKALMDIQAISLNPAHPYTWASGLKAPIYCDNRLIMSFPEVRSFIEEELVALIRSHYPKAEVIAGTATAGIPHAAIIADKMNLPMVYVRSNHKDHGKKNAIEGRIEPGQNVVMVADLISTGKSVIEAADKVEAAGGKVLGTVAIFSYELQKSHEAFGEQAYDLHPLISYPELIDAVASNEELFPYKETLNAWYKDPEKWSNEVE